MSSDNDNDNDNTTPMMQDGDSDNEVVAQQIRVSFRLAPEFDHDDADADDDAEHSLKVPEEAIAIPGHLQRKGLSAVINHLLGRRVRGDDDSSDSDNDDDDQLPPLEFEFLVSAGGDQSSSQQQQRLLRTSLDKETRRSGISTEQAVVVTYFPATPAPESQDEPGPELPDWVAALTAVDMKQSDEKNNEPYVISACYDGSLHVLQQKKENDTASESGASPSALHTVAAKFQAHDGPIKCLDSVSMTSDGSNNNSPSLWMATGSMDHTVSLHEWNSNTSSSSEIVCRATATHAASVASVSLWPKPILRQDDGDGPQLCMASGDWDGGVFLWTHSLSSSNSGSNDSEHDDVGGSKKRRTSSSEAKTTTTSTTPQTLSPTLSLQAHNSKVSGLCWGNFEKKQALTSNSTSLPEQLITASWDHSIKVWNVERQDCLLTLNSQRVVSCLDTSPHSAGICVTGHPDCSVRLWDLRASSGAEPEASSSLNISDNVFRPSHKAWISQVQWSQSNPYQVYSCSHDGTVKVWDIRSPTPLYTVRVLQQQKGSASSNNDKLLGLATLEGQVGGGAGHLYTGGTTRVVEQFELKRLKELA